MGATFKKLLGRKLLTREEVDLALKSVSDALVDADVAQVSSPTRPRARHQQLTAAAAARHQLVHGARAT
jgi:signal recognition particle GTPase